MASHDPVGVMRKPDIHGVATTSKTHPAGGVCGITDEPDQR